jgi:4-carboxymuconolactone decarboxylase
MHRKLYDVKLRYCLLHHAHRKSESLSAGDLRVTYMIRKVYLYFEEQLRKGSTAFKTRNSQNRFIATSATMTDYSRAGKIQSLASKAQSASHARTSEVDTAHKTLFESGLSIRRAVAGDKYVDAALETYSSDFSRPMQEYVTESCWHSIWSRPGLERKTRSLLNIAMLCALNRGTELAVHVRGAVNNGASEVEIREVCFEESWYMLGEDALMR